MEIIHLAKDYSKKYSFKKLDNYSFKEIIHFFWKIGFCPGLTPDYPARVLAAVGRLNPMM